MRALLLVVLVAGVGACTEHVQLGGGGLPGLQAIAVAPGTSTLTFDAIGAPAQHVAYTATGSFDDGRVEDITPLVNWSADNPYPGELPAPGDYVASGAAAGHVRVIASSGDITGSAELTINLSATVIDGVAPPPATDVFGGALDPDPAKTPVVRYPADGARFPQAMQPIVFQHDRGTGNDVVRLHITSDVLDLSILTGGDRYQPDDAIWTLIAASHPRSTATLTIEAATSTTPGTLSRGAPIDLAFSGGAATDLLYLFSTGAGVVRGSLAAVSTAPIAPAAMDPHHEVSRDGHLMALGAGDKLSTIDLESLAQLLAPMAPMGAAALSPDGTLVLVADKGALTLRSAITGMPVGPGGGKVMLGGAQEATHPDWSPDGTAVVIAMSDMVDNTDGKRLAIARLPFDAATKTFGSPEVLVPSTGDMDNNFSPRWGPDGSIAYVHATTGFKTLTLAELRLLPAGGTPITLARAEVSDTNSASPSWTVDSDGSAWLAFASTRPYGLLRPAKGAAQIWVAGIDLSRADPSYGAFWLPCQNLAVVNGHPVWAPEPRTTN